MIPAMVLFFAICPASGHACEEGLILARSCAAAEAHLRSDLRPGQTVHLMGCREFTPADWPRID